MDRRRLAYHPRLYTPTHLTSFLHGLHKGGEMVSQLGGTHAHNDSKATCMRVFICVYECECVYMCVYVCVSVCLYVFICVCVSVCMCKCTSVSVVHVRVRACVSA
jgi:hypothetical protein